MKILIAYATKSGAARVCAEKLAEKLETAEVFDLAKGSPDLRRYDAVVAGSGIRMGRLYRPMVQFLKKNREELLKKRLAVYCCNMEPDSAEKAFHRMIAPELLSHAVCAKSLGGLPPFKRPEGIDWLHEEALRELTDRLL